MTVGDSLRSAERSLAAHGLTFEGTELLNRRTGCSVTWDRTGSFGLISIDPRVDRSGIRVFVVAAEKVPIAGSGGIAVGSTTTDVVHAWPRHIGSDRYRSPAGGERLILDLPGVGPGSGGPLGWDGGRTAVFDTDARNVVAWYRVGDANFASHINFCSTPSNPERKRSRNSG